METYKTTAKHLKKFSRYVMKWQKAMSLERWAIFINHKDSEEDEDCAAAWVMADYETLVASITLAVTWSVPTTNSSLDMAAYHECRHLFYSAITYLVPEELEKVGVAEEHRLIVQDERMQFGKALSEVGADDGV